MSKEFSRGRRVALWSCVAGIFLLGAAVYALRGGIQEEYWLWKLRSRDPSAKQMAALRLGELRSVRAIPALFAGLSILPMEFACSRALVRIGGPAVPGLLNLLRDGSPPLRKVAAKALSEIRPAPKETISALAIQLREGDGFAAVALGSLGSEAVPVLVDAAKDRNLTGNVKHSILEALGEMGIEAQSAVPLQELAKGPGHRITRRPRVGRGHSYFSPNSMALDASAAVLKIKGGGKQ